MYLRKYCVFILVACVVYLLSSCASTSSLTTRDKEKIGTFDLVYVAPAENVTYRKLKYDIYNPALGAAGSAIGEGFAESDTLENRKLLTPYQQEIENLSFNDEMYAVVTNLITDTPWLRGKNLRKISAAANIDVEMRKLLNNTTDSVILFEPYVMFDPTHSQDVMIGMRVEVMKRDAIHIDDVYATAIHQTFSYSNSLTIDETAMSWQQQKATAHAIAAMNPTQTMAAWFANDAQELRTTFNNDLALIKKGMYNYFNVQN